MYATSMKDRILAVARAKARELQEAARPGSTVPELEEALDAAEGRPVVSRRPTLPTPEPVDDPPGDSSAAS
jgi:1-acyl-sn-glycerol-3-phosphate acyltransferase